MVGGTRGVGVLALALVGCTTFTGIEDEPAASSTGTDETSAGPGTSSDPSTTNNTGSDSQTSTAAPATSPPTGSASDSMDTQSTTEDGDTTSGTSDPTESGTTQGDSDTRTSETTTGAVCMEQDMEPNGTYEERQDLGVQECGADPSTASGTLLDEADIDYFWFQSPWSEPECGTLEPNHAYSITGPVELCVGLNCPGVPGTLTCPDGEFEAFDGFNFCCGTGSLDIDIVCDSVDETTLGFVRVRPNPKAPACADYSFTYEVYFD